MNSYNLPIFMSIGEGLVDNLINELDKNFKFILDKKILLLTTEKLSVIFIDKINIIKYTLPNIEVIKVKESSFDFAVELAKHICTKNINIILGLGGGTVLDTAKYASFVSKTTYIAIPTTLSNDGLASPISVLYSKNQKKKSFGSKIPEGIIIDTDIIANTPDILLKSGIGDTLSNYTALYDWKLDCNENGIKENDFAYMLSEMSFNSLFYSKEKSLKSKQSLKILSQSLVLSGLAMEIAGNSRPCSGSEHLFSHAMDELYDFTIPHGILVALGSLVACELQGRDNSILINYLNDYNILVNPKRLGISKEHFTNAWLFAKETRRERFTILNKIDISKAKFDKIYDKLLEDCK